MSIFFLPLRSRRTALLGATAALALAALPGAPEAQTADQRLAPFHLGIITALGTGLETTVFENPSAVSVIDDEEIERIPPARVADFLASVPGVRVEEMGITRISIRGEDARRVRILIDGQAVTDHTTYGPPVVVDPSMVERIEVVRGASSVVSGQRAIGGTINIVTRRGGIRPLEGALTASYFGATEGRRLSGTLAGRQGGFNWRLSAGRSEIGNQHAAGLGELPNSDVQDRNRALWLGYDWGPHQIGLQGTAFDLAANVYTGDPDFIIQMPARNLRKLGFFYTGTDLTPWLSRLEVNVFRQTIDREFRNDVTVRPSGARIITSNEDTQTTAGLNATAELRVSDRWRAVVGVQHEDDHLDVNAMTQAIPPGVPFPPPPSYRLDEARIRTTSFFAQNEYEFAPGLTGTLGLRGYRVRAELEASNTNPLTSNRDSRLLGSLGLSWQRSENMVLRASVSQGYNYPTLNQLFTSTTAGGQVTNPNPDLRPEASDNIEIGARFDDGRVVLDGTLFHARARDYILRQVVPGSGPIPVGQYQNVSQARTTGIELYGEYALAGGWTPYVTATWLRRQIDYGNGYRTHDSATPALSGTIGVRRDFDLGSRAASLDAFVTGESGVVLRDAGGAVSAQAGGYAVLGLRGSVDLTPNARLTLQVNNLTDRRYHGYGQLPGARRSLDLVVQARF